MGLLNAVKKFFTGIEYEINSPISYHNAAKIVRTHMDKLQSIFCPSDDAYQKCLKLWETEQEKIDKYKESSSILLSKTKEVEENIRFLFKNSNHICAVHSKIQSYLTQCTAIDEEIVNKINSLPSSTYESLKSAVDNITLTISSREKYFERITVSKEDSKVNESLESIHSFDKTIDFIQTMFQKFLPYCNQLTQKLSDLSQTILLNLEHIKNILERLNLYSSPQHPMNRQFQILESHIKLVLVIRSISQDWSLLCQQKQYSNEYLIQQKQLCKETMIKYQSLLDRIQEQINDMDTLKEAYDHFNQECSNVRAKKDLLSDTLANNQTLQKKIKEEKENLANYRRILKEKHLEGVEFAKQEEIQFKKKYSSLPNGTTSVYLNWKSVEKFMELFDELKDTFQHPYCQSLLQCSWIEQDFKDSIHFEDYIDRCNRRFIRSQMKRLDLFFSNINQKSLDLGQCKAVLTDEDYTQVVAGAGSGKTFTIQAKVKYLVDILDVPPEKILLLSFNRTAAEQLEQHVIKEMGYPVKVKTFHGYGYEIFSSKNPNIGVFHMEKNSEFGTMVEKIIQKECSINQDFAQKLLDFSILYQVQPKSRYEFPTLNAYCEQLNQVGLNKLKTILNSSPDINQDVADFYDGKYTLDGNHVRSYEEWVIANYLFLNGIKYEYERPFPQTFQDEYNKRPYHPDFYLVDYDLYWEHFGIDASGQASFLSGLQKTKYEEWVTIKRNKFKECHMTLLETTSNDFSNGKIYEKIDCLLKQHHIVKQPISAKEITAAIFSNQNCRLFSQAIRLISDYLNLYKSNCYGILDISKAKQRVIGMCQTDFEKKRIDLFFYLFAKIITNYEQMLLKSHQIDFNDMISKAIQLLKERQYSTDFDYVIVDEFQDISYSRYELLKAILSQNAKTKLFCVGDDWQSIYRFTGSDLNYFLDFPSNWSHSKQLMIEQTYRNSQELIDIAGAFIMKNEHQVPKHLLSSRHIKHPIYIIEYDDTSERVNQEKDAFRQALNYLNGQYKTKQDLMILSRTNQGLETARRILKSGYQYLTVHKSKGLEAEAVILTDVSNKLNGFPNQMSDDILLKSLLCKPESYPYAEERRLFYVALTRTKGSIVILTPSNSKSAFISELQESFDVIIDKIPAPKQQMVSQIAQYNESKNSFF